MAPIRRQSAWDSVTIWREKLDCVKTYCRGYPMTEQECQETEIGLLTVSPLLDSTGASSDM